MRTARLALLLCLPLPAAAVVPAVAARGHRRNMLSREAQDFALARAPGNIRVMLLARPGC